MKFSILIMLLSMAALGGKMKDWEAIQLDKCSRVVRVVKGDCCDCKSVVIKWQKKQCCGKCESDWVTKDTWYPGKWPFHVINQLFIRAD